MNAKYTEIVGRLKEGRAVTYREGGSSMEPRLHDGEAINVKPIADHDTLKAGDIVLCKVNGRMFTHLIRLKQWRKKKGGEATLWFQIANNHGFVNGWTTADKVYGVVTS